MRQNLFSAGDHYTVRDENGREAFRVDGRAVDVCDRLSFRDLLGRELAFIRRKVLPWGMTYEVYYADELHSVVKQQDVAFARASFAIDEPGPDDLRAAGDLPGHEYAFTRDGHPVATVSKKWVRPSDSYGVDVTRGEDDVLILAGTVVLDVCCRTADRAVPAAPARNGKAPGRVPAAARCAPR
jgi:uncharacterized protein YxjI